ncbi:MAG TPA: fatty acid--CoA ligase family protein, partial [Candidatus Ozemobacteraceae bacterium]|nr:fatty acid--CoA ligase family protein [Candidatus Ozemobacteraceae bacterium]
LKLILQELRTGQHQVDSLRCLVSSSALLDPSLKAELLEHLPCDFHECYGTSEIAIASNLDRAAGLRKTASVGVAAPGVDIRILDDQQKPLPANQPGEIACRTPMRFAGYYQRPDLTDAAMWGEYFRTGDIGKLDDEGFLFFLGRKKEIIITGGVNVYPQDVESALLTHPQVSECAVVPMPDNRLGEVVCAVIVARDRSQLNIRDLQRISARQLADYQQPHHYIILDELPKNRMGKLMKQELLKLLQERKYQ